MDCRPWPTTGFTAALRGGSEFLSFVLCGSTAVSAFQDSDDTPSSSRVWSVAAFSEPPVDSGAHAKIRYALQGGVVHTDGQVRAEFALRRPDHVRLICGPRKTEVMPVSSAFSPWKVSRPLVSPETLSCRATV